MFYYHYYVHTVIYYRIFYIRNYEVMPILISRSDGIRKIVSVIEMVTMLNYHTKLKLSALSIMMFWSTIILLLARLLLLMLLIRLIKLISVRCQEKAATRREKILASTAVEYYSSRMRCWIICLAASPLVVLVLLLPPLLVVYFTFSFLNFESITINHHHHF